MSDSERSTAMEEYQEALPTCRVLPVISDLLQDAEVVAAAELARLKDRASRGGTMTAEDVRRFGQIVSALKVMKETQRMVNEDEDLSDQDTADLERELLERGRREAANQTSRED